ncbi:unnamed protein product [Rotaria socialis]|uniref:Uncharacterized protein n=1 Tax=Rotaria socialis TaxID=392032 RepID=A0A818FI74_9BILA|nr:unnamed protein product [Rotaria socialis]CAF3372644.1 unnamed protein product [Rotaria socialis]CAF3408132.1 unnamed protein product [Rotaria socialis]CAF3474440.1 unnamed protein product [Rotaria socialis]CAF4216557.1 unnamed protein product [Rotaria socialis]
MNEGAALRVLSFLSDSNQQHVDSLLNEKPKVTVIGEEHEPDEFIEEKPTIPAIDDETELSPEIIKEFFKATHEGSIDRLEALFDTISGASPNMTCFTESLLMAAIRAQRYKVAEYLIDQLGVNVNHTCDQFEFRINSQIPIREQTVSCRDLAYTRGMMDLVDLIDITSDDVKPSVKRYLQRRLKVRLDQIHQAYLKRMKERSRRLTIQIQERNKQIVEEDDLEKDNEEPSSANVIDNDNNNNNINNDNSAFQQSLLLQPIVPRQYKSHIEATIRSIESKTDKSIDETGKKLFRFSGYSLRYRLVETGNTNQQKQERSRPKTAIVSFPFVPTTSTRPILQSAMPPSRPMTTATTPNVNRRSASEVSARIPIRETRTSICRSARRTATPRTCTTINSESKPEVISSAAAAATTTAATTVSTAAINITQRLLPKRIRQFDTNYAYVPQLQHSAVYNDPRRFLPVTLKTTATGLLSGSRLIRE